MLSGILYNAHTLYLKHQNIQNMFQRLSKINIQESLFVFSPRIPEKQVENNVNI